MFHLALYDSSIASATANQQLAGVADPVIAPAGTNGFLVNSQCKYIARLAAVGNILVRAQLTSGSLRDYTPFDVAPVNVGTVIGNPARRLEFLDQPIPLSVNEELDAFITNSAGTATRTSVAVWFSDGPIRPVKGRMFTVRWTGTTTLVASAWTAVTMTFDNGLPSGTFAIVGSRVEGTSPLFHRFVPRGGSPLRPGSFAVQVDSDYQDLADRYGGLGEWMRFTNTTPPQCEVFARAADTAQTGFLDLMQVG